MSIKPKFSHFVCLLSLIVLFSCASKQEFTKRDVKRSERLIGIHFPKEGRDTLYPYLKRNREGYDSLRKFPLGNDVFPAVRFDPVPFGFEMPEQADNQTWEIPDHVEIPEPYNDLAFYTIPQLASLIKHQKITSTELTQFFLARLKKYQPTLQCSISITDSLALAQAERADEELKNGIYRGILHGIPYGTKDLMSVPGYTTTWGAAPYQNQVLDETATVVKKLEDAGAILVAKLVSGALARGDVWFGGKTKNPWDIKQGASGSSAGSGSATSAGLVPFALGTETLGSITSPSTRNGITGLRPTYGRVSRYGVMSLSWSMDKVGPMGRNAEDCAIVFSVIQGKDKKDLTTVDLPFGVDWDKDIAHLKIAYLKKDIEKDTTESGDNLRTALKKLEEMGVHPIPVEMPKEIPYRGFDIILRAEAGAFFDELVRSGEVDMMVEQDQRSRANSLRQSRFIPAVEYLQANRQRQVLIEKMHSLMKDYDVLISPTFGNDQLLATNLTGHPVIAIPTGLDKENHPTSMTFVGNLYDEASILLLAKAFQEQTAFDELHPPGF
ncbi:amidase [Allomuricauda sp. CP2A]|jgi:Asp-tRNA(Asn)/Glu-tRNA(Gln) amidotransferase A subunit family amidase|uniref:amidase n=1 Tax=Allomuricauda sp. CP2A TaxID=1848189 RepID=UPI00083286A8|nr:amidase [Muricauda sp. CP2A]